MTARRSLVLLMAALMGLTFPPPALAGEDKTEDVIPCEFTVDFPSEPYTVRRCPDGERNAPSCYEVRSFTRVFDMTTTVNIRVTCNPADGNMYDRYTTAVMKATLESMVRKNRDVKDYDITMRETDKAKVAGLVGAGESGLTPTLYAAQLWIGHRSVFTVEAEIIGDTRQEADRMFSDILRSIRHESDKPAADTKDRKSDNTQPDDKTDGDSKGTQKP